MKFSYKFSIEIPQSFLDWLEANGYKRIGKTFTWKSTKTQWSAKFVLVRIVPSANNSYNIVREWWGRPWASKDYAYDTQTDSTFHKFLKRTRTIRQ
jgi:hypothetical protein